MSVGKAIHVSGKKSGAWLVRHALEQLPISHTFGIPGVHNTELYDELNKSERIHPVLVTHEGGASFIADAISRTSQKGEIGVLVIVPAAGLTHAMSGIGEAFLDGIPMLIISGGTRTDVPFGYQLHELDQHKILAGLTKGSWLVKEHREIIPTIYEAYHRAISGTPGPVFVEIPVNLQLFQGDADDVPDFRPALPAPVSPDADALLDQAVELLAAARAPGLFVGWGAVDVAAETQQLADLLGAPVSTTLQGLSAFPGNHPLHTGMGFSRAAVPAAENAFKGCDCLLAIGTRFGEIPTGSFGCVVPENLIHIDINGEVLGRNFKPKVAIEGDARAVVPLLREKLRARLAAGGPENANAARRTKVAAQIAADKHAYKKEWAAHLNARVNPSLFFDALRARLDHQDIMVVDDGNHTFLAAELFQVGGARSFISPTDFNCMGYCVPAAIGAKLVNPDRQVVGIVGDGAFLMTGLEILTATTEGAGVAYFIFSDGELSQISQGQEIPYNRKTCTIVGTVRLEGIATATGARYIALESNDRIAAAIDEALAVARSGQPVIVDIRIDYSKRTRFTLGVVKTVLKRFPLGEKFRFIGRAVVRKVTG
ncbi:MAG: acetolactate synthase large subunit [Myxococcales bacterium]|jgi:acetolactate synthase-1/2/3 large subunit|nr:acetolactate synthase large subunit [Myxococcales bacterium]